MSITSLYRRNVGGLDRGIRLVVGAPLVAVGLFLAGGNRGEPFGVLVAVVGLMGLLSAIAGRCPLYAPFGISTARVGWASRRASACEAEKEPRARGASAPAHPIEPRAGW